MYIHIGADVSFPAHWIVGIFDLDQMPPSSATAELMKQAEEAYKLDWMSAELPRSMLLTVDRVFLSPLSSVTLVNRLKDRYKDERLP